MSCTMDMPSMTRLDRVPSCPLDARVFMMTDVLDETMATVYHMDGTGAQTAMVRARA